MNKNKDHYYRFEIFCRNFVFDNQGYVKEKSWDLKNEDVYVENITTINSLKNRIMYFSNLWQEIETNTHVNHTKEYVGFPIFNKWNNYAVVGFCHQGWLFIENSFAIYIHKYLIEKCKTKYSDCLKAIEGDGYDFNLITNYVEKSMHLITEEIMDIELKHFLENKEIPDEVKQEVYYPEMVRRGYIDIIDKIVV